MKYEGLKDQAAFLSSVVAHTDAFGDAIIFFFFFFKHKRLFVHDGEADKQRSTLTTEILPTDFHTNQLHCVNKLAAMFFYL